MAKQVEVIGRYGLRWPRNRENLRRLKQLLGKATGIYVLANGAMPLYIGKGRVASRVRGHARSGKTKSRYWNYFSWFETRSGVDAAELECLLLNILPFFIRSLNRQTGKLKRDNRQEPVNDHPITVELPKLLPRKKH